MVEMIEPKSKEQVPYYTPLAEMYRSWVPDFVEVLKAQKKYIKAREEYHAIRKQPLKKTDMQTIWIESFNNYAEGIKHLLAGRLISNYSDRDPFSLLTRENINPVSLINKEIFIQAISLVPEPENAVTLQEKTKGIKSSEKKMSDAKKIISANSPQGFMMLKSGQIQNDTRYEFTNAWFDVQRWLSRPCGPRGIDLEFSNANEKWAYDKLGVAKSISQKSKKVPFRPK